MNFGEALEQLKLGARVARKGWNIAAAIRAKKEYLLMCQFDKNKRFRRAFNNSDRQVKDGCAYFLHF